MESQPLPNIMGGEPWNGGGVAGQYGIARAIFQMDADRHIRHYTFIQMSLGVSSHA